MKQNIAVGRCLIGMNVSQKRRRKTIRFQRGDALLIIDSINDLNFPGAEQILPWAVKLAALCALESNDLICSG
jgi:hypothetical protein